MNNNQTQASIENNACSVFKGIFTVTLAEIDRRKNEEVEVTLLLPEDMLKYVAFQGDNAVFTFETAPGSQMPTKSFIVPKKNVSIPKGNSNPLFEAMEGHL